jgi:hypothetical protein
VGDVHGEPVLLEAPLEGRDESTVVVNEQHPHHVTVPQRS